MNLEGFGAILALRTSSVFKALRIWYPHRVSFEGLRPSRAPVHSAEPSMRQEMPLPRACERKLPLASWV